MVGRIPSGVDARVARALRVARLCDRPERAFRVSDIDVSNPVYLVLLTADNRFIRLVWEEISDDAAILQGLSMADDTLRDPASRAHRQFDVILSAGKVFGG